MAKNRSLILVLLIVGVVAAHIVVAGGLTIFGEDLNKLVFQRKHVSSHEDKIWLVQTLGLWLALYLFSLAVMVMSLRIVTGKSLPASNQDPVYITTLNRIITNTIEQSVIFAGLYAPILFSDKNNIQTIGATRVLTLASLFVLGRVVFSIGYVLGSLTNIPSLRSFGFAIGLLNNLTMISYHLGFNVYDVLNDHATPILKGFL